MNRAKEKHDDDECDLMNSSGDLPYLFRELTGS